MAYKLDQILFGENKAFPLISAVDHYCGHEKLLIKSLETQTLLNGSFDITFDLEDGASVGQESALKELFFNIAGSELNAHKKLGLRIHDYQSEHFNDDLEFALTKASGLISHLTIPKILNFEQAKQITEAISKLRKDSTQPIPPVHFLIETIAAVQDVFRIAALPYLRGLDFGCMDYVSCFNGAIHSSAMYSPMQFENTAIVNAKTQIVIACIANGLIPTHNVCVDYQDPQSAFNDALTAKNKFGFLRMWSIHPNQIKPILEAFAPDEAEIKTASQILLKAKQANWAPTSLNGRLHDRASYRYFWNILKQAKSQSLNLDQEVNELFY